MKNIKEITAGIVALLTIASVSVTPISANGTIVLDTTTAPITTTPTTTVGNVTSSGFNPSDTVNTTYTTTAVGSDTSSDFNPIDTLETTAVMYTETKNGYIDSIYVYYDYVYMVVSCLDSSGLYREYNFIMDNSIYKNDLSVDVGIKFDYTRNPDGSEEIISYELSPEDNKPDVTTIDYTNTSSTVTMTTSKPIDDSGVDVSYTTTTAIMTTTAITTISTTSNTDDVINIDAELIKNDDTIPYYNLPSDFDIQTVLDTNSQSMVIDGKTFTISSVSNIFDSSSSIYIDDLKVIGYYYMFTCKEISDVYGNSSQWLYEFHLDGSTEQVLTLQIPDGGSISDYNFEETGDVEIGNSEDTGIRGDINYDGKVNVSDLIYLRRYLLHLIKW